MDIALVLSGVSSCLLRWNEDSMRCKPILCVCKSDGVFDKVVEICS